MISGLFKTRLGVTALIAAALAAVAAFYMIAQKENNVSGANKPEAKAMVKKALAFIDQHGEQKTYVEINNRVGQFTDRDLYLVAYDMDGVVHAHGANARMLGKNLVNLVDIDGKAFIQERIELAKKHQSFWQEYKFLNPENRRIERKTTYCERREQLIICGGIYPES